MSNENSDPSKIAIDVYNKASGTLNATIPVSKPAELLDTTFLQSIAAMQVALNGQLATIIDKLTNIDGALKGMNSNTEIPIQGETEAD